MPIANALPELNFQAGDYSNALYKGAEFKRQQQQDAAVQETRDLTNEGLRQQNDRSNPLRMYQENKARSELKTQIIKDYTRDAQEWMALPDADKPAAYETLHNTYKQYTPSMPGADAYEGDPKKMAEGVKQSLTNISNMGKDGTPAEAIITNPAWKSEADTEKGVPHYLKKSGINSYDGTVKWDESKTEPYLSKWEEKMWMEKAKNKITPYQQESLNQRERHFKTTEGRAAAKDAKETVDKGDPVLIGARKFTEDRWNQAAGTAGKDEGIVRTPEQQAKLLSDTYAKALRDKGYNPNELGKKYPKLSYEEIYNAISGK